MSVNTLLVPGIPSVPPDFMIASPALGDAKEDASTFLKENIKFMKQTNVDRASSSFMTAMAIYRKIPTWLMMPLFATCMVLAIILGVPLLVVLVKLLEDPQKFMQIASLVSLVWIVGIIGLFI